MSHPDLRYVLPLIALAASCTAEVGAPMANPEILPTVAPSIMTRPGEEIHLWSFNGTLLESTGNTPATVRCVALTTGGQPEFGACSVPGITVPIERREFCKQEKAGLPNKGTIYFRKQDNNKNAAVFISYIDIAGSLRRFTRCDFIDALHADHVEEDRKVSLPPVRGRVSRRAAKMRVVGSTFS